MKKLCALLALGTAALLWVMPVYACTCVVPPPPRESIEASDVVFTGEVTRLARRNGAGEYLVSFRIEDVYKGDRSSLKKLTTATTTAACGFPFTKGERYIVYALRQEDGRLTAGLCSRTARLADAAEDLEALAPYAQGSDVVGASGPLCGGPSNTAVLQGFFIVLFFVIVRVRRPR